MTTAADSLPQAVRNLAAAVLRQAWIDVDLQE